MNKLHAIRGSSAPERKPVEADRLIEGAPMTETRLDYEREGTYVGEWSCGVGAWRVAYDEWEFCHVLEGACELVPDGGEPRSFKSGDSFVIEPGFSGVWRVLAPMKKRFVVEATGCEVGPRASGSPAPLLATKAPCGPEARAPNH